MLVHLATVYIMVEVKVKVKVHGYMMKMLLKWSVRPRVRAF